MNLPIDMRFDHDVIQLLAIVRHPAVMRWGQAGVFCGVDKKGERIADGPTISDDFQEGAKGRWTKLLNTDGSEEWWRIVPYLICVCADYPQAQGMLPFNESASGAYCPCRGCNYRQDRSMRHEKPHSFFEDSRTWKLRSLQRLLADIERWRQRGDPGSEMQDAGVNKLVYTLCADFFPHINPTNIAPQDIMHNFPDGITRHEAAWLLYMLHSRKHLSLSQVNDAIARHKWPRDCRVPKIPASVEDGATGRFPRSDATIHMSASQTITFALHRYAPTPPGLASTLAAHRSLCNACVTHCVTHCVTRCAVCSVSLLSPLLSESAKQTTYWQSWVAHVRVLEMSLRTEYTLADVTTLDDCIQRHHKLFFKVSPAPSSNRSLLLFVVAAYARCLLLTTPCLLLLLTPRRRSLQVKEYDGLWKPKHHFITHTPIDLLRFGPPRGFWCMSFEGFNKLIKQAAELSNYRAEDVFVLEHWVFKSARMLRRKRDRAWCA
jgi:hypothetical protein|tara:strand:- start:78 stop:1547 length:1470 start_codon:yes stop_codon:yes gene_type:complete